MGLDENTVSYYFLEASADELAYLSSGDWKRRFLAKFEVQPENRG